MKHVYARIVCLFLIVTSLVGQDAFAEGSKELFSTATGQRTVLLSNKGSLGLADFGIPEWVRNYGTHYAFAIQNEIIAVASSAMSNTAIGSIIITSPSGVVTTITTNSNGGTIANRTAEFAGPRTTGATADGSKYRPYDYTAGETGIFKIEFKAQGSGTATRSPQTTVLGNESVSGEWTQVNGTNNTGIWAWDVSVRSGTTWKPGRVYAKVLNMGLPFGTTSAHGYHGTMYAFTKDGYAYQVGANGQIGGYFTFFVNNRGFTSQANGAGVPEYKSVNQTTNVNVWSPLNGDDGLNVTHKMFYNKPSPDLTATANIYKDDADAGTVVGNTGTTWLKNAPVVPEVTNPQFVGVEELGSSVSNKGAIVKFNSSLAGTYKILIPVAGGHDRVLIGPSVVGQNSVPWDGKQGTASDPTIAGAKVPQGTILNTVKVQLFGAEVHFPFLDVEQNPRGMVIHQTDASFNALSLTTSPDADVVYWDDTDITPVTAGKTPPSPVKAALGLTVQHSNGTTPGAHKWGTYGGTQTADWGNERALDTYTFIPGEEKSVTVNVTIREAELKVTSLTKSAGPATVTSGDTFTFTTQIANDGEDNTTGTKAASFWFYVPKGVVINPNSVTFVGAGSAALNVSSPATFDANTGIYKVKVDLPKNGSGTFTIPATVGYLSASTINAYATIMRPQDITDPNATNETTVSPLDPWEEATGTAYTPIEGNNFTPTSVQLAKIGNGTGGTTNNIKALNLPYFFTICVGSNSPLPLAQSGVGNTTWVSSSSSIASINSPTADGIIPTLIGVAPGNITITRTKGTSIVFSIKVVEGVTTPVVGLITQPTDAVPTGSVAFSGLPSTGTWTLTSSKGATKTGTGTTTTFTGLAQGTHTFTVTNSGGCVSTATTPGTVLNSSPVAVADVNSTNEDVTLTVGDGLAGDILLNDTDADGNNTISVSKYTIAGIGTDQLINSVVTLPNGAGTINIQANGSYVYIPGLNFNGAVPVITYTITDPTGLTASSTLTLTVNPINDAPVANPDVNSTNKNVTLTVADGAAGDVLLNDTDVDAATTLVVTKFTVPGLGSDQLLNSTITIPGGSGTINMQANGSYVFTPAVEFFGAVPVITYFISDGNGGTASSTLTITVNQTNVAPVPVANTNTMLEDGIAISVAAVTTGATGGLLANDTDANGDVLTITGFTVNGVAGPQAVGGTGYAITGVGTIVVNANGSYTFMPLANY
ncbi:MAG: hypothetical protein EOP51_18355, partial [Sphingobacteriales bacterium]